MCGYLDEKKEVELYKDSPKFEYITKLFEPYIQKNPSAFDIHTFMGYLGYIQDEVDNYLLNKGMSDEEIDSIRKETDDYFEAYFVHEATKKYLKVDIQNKVSNFLDAYMLRDETIEECKKREKESIKKILDKGYKEGESNGK